MSTDTYYPQRIVVFVHSRITREELTAITGCDIIISDTLPPMTGELGRIDSFRMIESPPMAVADPVKRPRQYGPPRRGRGGKTLRW